MCNLKLAFNRIAINLFIGLYDIEKSNDEEKKRRRKKI